MADKPVFSLDEAADQLTRTNIRWKPGQTVEYTFPTAAPANLATQIPWPNFVVMSPQGAAVARQVLAHVSEIANITFKEVPYQGSVDALLSLALHSRQPPVAAGTPSWRDTAGPDGYKEIYRAQLFIGAGEPSSGYDIGRSYYFLTMHELGHTLGLSHPSDYQGPNPTYETHAVYFQDSAQYTVMTYWHHEKTGAVFKPGERLATFGLYDIAALQKLYGANMATRAGDSVYGFNSNAGGIYDFASSTARVMAIWDGGGTDTLDLSGFSTGSTIDLNEGAFSSFDERIMNLSIARGAVIENAVGGSGNDKLIGNAAANLLGLQAGGDDTAEGGDGNDIFYYGAAFTAADRSDGGEGNDRLVLQGNYPSLTLDAASLKRIEGISLQSGSITRWGQKGDSSYDYGITTVDASAAAGQQLLVNAQSLRTEEDFTFNGSAETDGRFLVYGGFGTDDLTGGSGNDIFFFEAGRFGPRDRVDGGGGSDAVVISGKPVQESGPLTLTIAKGTLTSIEALSFNGRFSTDPEAKPSYKVTMDDGNITPGEWLIVNASSLGPTQTLSFDASAVARDTLVMLGGGGADTLVAGAGNDRFYAAGGADLLRGGAGKDIFEYRSTSDSKADAADRILDFATGSDMIDLSRIDADAALDGDQAFTFIGDAAFSKKAGELRSAFDTDAAAWRIEGDVNGDGAADFLILVTTTGQASPLGSADFVA